METRIFFNPGDSIANIHDYNEAIRKGQIFKKERKVDDLVIAKDKDNEEYAIFYARDAKQEPHDSTKEYEIKKHVQLVNTAKMPPEFGPSEPGGIFLFAAQRYNL